MVKGKSVKSGTAKVLALPSFINKDSLILHNTSQFFVLAPSQVEVGQRIRINYIAYPGDVEDFYIDDFQGFNVIYGPSTSRSSVWGNDGFQLIVVFSYIVEPIKQGTLKIPHATIKVEGKSIISETASIEVLPKGQ